MNQKHIIVRKVDLVQPRKTIRISKSNIILNITFLLVIVITTILYVKSERVFYYSDYMGYHNLTIQTASEFHQSFLNAIKNVYLSTGLDYNTLPIIPLLPFTFLFGEGRISYIVSLVVVYLVPFSLIIGLVATQIIPLNRRLVFWSAVLISLLTPMFWIPSLRGYPDTCSALLITASISLYLRDPNLKSYRQIFCIGLLLSLAVLFRRHFAYDVVAFFMAIVSYSIISTGLNGKSQLILSAFVTKILRTSLILISFLISLAVFGHRFIGLVLVSDYNSAYQSYVKPPLTILGWLIESYGWVIVIAAIAGFILGAYYQILESSCIFIVLFGLFVILEWVLIVRQASEHYTLHFTFVFISGLTALLWTGWAKLKRPLLIVALTIGGGWLLLTSITGLTTINIFSNSPISTLVPVSYPPLVQNDYDEIIRLINYIVDQSKEEQTLFTVASSSVVSYDMLKEAVNEVFGRQTHKLEVIRIPQIDSRDFYPLEGLLQANYVVVADPFQHDLDAKEQQLVKVVYDMFTQNQDIAKDFELLPVKFSLDQEVIAHLYRRIRETSDQTAINTLNLIKEYVPKQPSGQFYWVSLTPLASSSRNWTKKTTITAPVTLNSPLTSSLRLLYTEPLRGKIEISGKIAVQAGSCNGVALDLSLLDAQGNLVASSTKKLASGETTFSISEPTQDTNYRMFTLSIQGEYNQQGKNTCSLQLEFPMNVVGK